MDVAPVDGLKNLAVEPLPPKQLHHGNAQDVFLDPGVELGELFPHAEVGIAKAALQLDDHSANRQDNEDQQQAQIPALAEHYHRDYRQGKEVADDADRAGGKHIPQSFYIAGDAGDQLAHWGAIEKLGRQGKHVGKEIIADVAGHQLPQLLAGIPFQGLKNPAGQQGEDQQAHVGPEAGEDPTVALGERLGDGAVQGPLQDQGLHRIG